MSRMGLWLLVSLVLAGLIAVIAPQQLGVTAYKLSLITSAAWVGYWIDRGLFPYARPDKGQDYLMGEAMHRRAIIIAACVVGVALGA